MYIWASISTTPYFYVSAHIKLESDAFILHVTKYRGYAWLLLYNVMHWGFNISQHILIRFCPTWALALDLCFACHQIPWIRMAAAVKCYTMRLQYLQIHTFRLCPSWACALGLCFVGQQRHLLLTMYIRTSKLQIHMPMIKLWIFLGLRFICHQIARICVAAVVSDVDGCLVGGMHSTHWVIAQISDAQLPAAAIWIYDTSCWKLWTWVLNMWTVSRVLEGAQLMCCVIAQFSNAQLLAAAIWIYDTSC